VKEEVENALYPNPTSGISPRFPFLKNSVKLHDAKGNLIMNLKGPLQTVDCSGLSNGVYSMHTQTLKGV
jgi:hypothetical protein